MHPASRPVGIFDSGVGGLSVLEAVRHELPAENLIYVADSAHVPYAEQPRALIEQRAMSIARFLVREGAKAVVVACNTATGMVIETLRSRVALPIVGIEPAVKPAAAETKTGVVGVLATPQTLASSKFSRLLAQHAAGVDVLLQACPGLAEQVERGKLSGDATCSLVEAYVRPLLDRGADTLVLGCTHYPFLRDLIEKVAGPGVAIVDPAVAVARELHRRLEADEQLSRRSTQGSECFWTSARPEEAQPVISQLLARRVIVERMPPEFCDGG